MKKKSCVIGIIGGVLFMLSGVAELVMCRVLDFEGVIFKIITILGCAMIGYGLLGIVLSIFASKSKAASIILIILGAPLVLDLVGLFYIIAGSNGLKNLKAASVEEVKNEVIESEAKITENPVIEESNGFEEEERKFEKADDEEIDITREKRPKGQRFGGKWYPSKSWFSTNGVPIKEIPIEKRTLKRLSDEQKYVFALATFAIVKIKALFIIFAFIVSLVIGFSASASAGEPMGFAITIALLMIVGGFIVIKPAKLIDGFTIVNGTFKDRIDLPFYWDLIFYVAWLIGSVWSLFATFILTLFDMTRREKMLSLPRVGVPQNIGFDDMIDVYAAYERACSVDDAFNQFSANAAKRDYDRKQSELDSIKTQTSASGLSASDKQAIINAADSVKKHNEEVYNDNIKPNL